MAVTHHSGSKCAARKMAHRLRKAGNKVSVKKLKGPGYAVTSYK
jgi:hypothetical protein